MRWDLWTPATTTEVEIYSRVTGLGILFRCSDLKEPTPENLVDINVMLPSSRLREQIQIPESAKTFAAMKIARARRQHWTEQKAHKTIQ